MTSSVPARVVRPACTAAGAWLKVIVAPAGAAGGVGVLASLVEVEVVELLVRLVVELRVAAALAEAVVALVELAEVWW